MKTALSNILEGNAEVAKFEITFQNAKEFLLFPQHTLFSVMSKIEIQLQLIVAT